MSGAQRHQAGAGTRTPHSDAGAGPETAVRTQEGHLGRGGGRGSRPLGDGGRDLGRGRVQLREGHAAWGPVSAVDDGGAK